MAAPSFLSRLRDTYRWYGLRGLFCIAFRRFFSRFIRIERVHFFAIDPRLPTPAFAPHLAADIRVATAADLHHFAADLERLTAVGADEASQWLANGRLAFVAVHDGALAAVRWLGFGSQYVRELDMTLMLAPDEACGFGAVTDDKWRGQGLLPAINAVIDQYQRDQGMTNHISWVRADNAPSIRAVGKSGRRRTATVTSFWVVGMRRPIATGVPASGSPRLVPGRVP